jgi:hypothetical protein
MDTTYQLLMVTLYVFYLSIVLLDNSMTQQLVPCRALVVPRIVNCVIQHLLAPNALMDIS